MVSITEDLNSLVCLERESLSVTHFFDLDPRTIEKKVVFEQALKITQRLPGCNHMLFSKHEPEGAIMKIFDGYLC